MDDAVHGDKAMSQHGNGQTPASEHGNYSELAEANLLRLRGRYKDALDKCTELLKHTPRDPTLHVLIGDIYRDQGQISEAVQWYQMALDLDPDNPEYAEKLEKLEQQEVASTKRWQWWHWILLTTATALAAVALGAGLAWRATRNPTNQVSTPPPSPTQPASPAEMPPGLRTPPGTSSAGSPYATTTPAFTPNRQTETTQGVSGQEAERTVPHEALSSSEQALLQLISQSVKQELGDRLSVVSFTMDPRTHSAVVTVNKPVVPATREAVSTFLTEVRTVALWTLSVVGTADSLTIRVLSRFPMRKGVSGPVEVIFIGDVERNSGSFQQNDPNQWFTQQWWHPRLTALTSGQNSFAIPNVPR